MNKYMVRHFILGGAVVAWCISIPIHAAPTIPFAGTVGETINADRYTYVRVDTQDGSCWVATMPADYQVGAAVNVSDGVEMKDFTSPVLGRTFERVVFTESISSSASMTMPGIHGGGLPPGHPPTGSSKPMCPVDSGKGEEAGGFSGHIVETMNAGGYTYIHVKGSDKSVWAATDEFDAKIGQNVVIPDGMVMHDFKSPSLGRTFDEIYFVDRVVIKDGDGEIEQAESATEGDGGYASEDEGGYAQPAAPTDPITVPEGGLTVADILARGTELAGQEVLVRGRVTKFSPNILEKNWVHLRDDSLSDGDEDLTVTTANEFEIGDVVTLRGRIAVDVQLGPHYAYPVMMEDAVAE